MTVVEDWEQFEWGDLATLEYGKSLKNYRNGEGSIEVFGTNGPIGWTAADPLASGPGVVVGRKGAYRGIHLAERDFYVIDTAFWLNPIRDFDIRWAYYELLTHDINSMDSGSAIPSTSRDAFYNLPVSLPPIATQRAIARTLGALDSKIESNEQIVELTLDLLDAYADDVAGRDIELIPLGDLAAVARNTADPSKMGDVVVHHFSIPAFDRCGFPESVAADSIKSNKLLLEEPAILVSRLNPRINRTWWACPIERLPALASTEFLALSTERASDRGGLWLSLRNRYFRQELQLRVTGTSGSHQRIRPDDVLAIEVPDTRNLPPAEKERVMALLRVVQQRRTESQVLSDLRDSLLPEVISGWLCVPSEGAV